MRAYCIPLGILLASLVFGEALAEDCNGNGVADEIDVQVDFLTTVLVSGANAAQAVLPVDLDGDGDRDLLYGGGGAVAWVRNLDGRGGFGSEEIILGGLAEVTSVATLDLDGDLDLDVVSASDELRWHENLDGQGTFGPGVVIAGDPDPRDVTAADVDGDLDLDLVVAYHGGDRIVWFEHIGVELFAPGRPVADGAGEPWSIVCADIDDDGDPDVVATLRGLAAVAWYENLYGTGDFGPPVVVADGLLGAAAVAVADIDGDGYLDVLVGAEAADKLAWIPGTGGGAFGSPVTISNAADGPRAIVSADLDGDGDPDVASASFFDDTLAWFENVDGAGGFGPLLPITTSAGGATSVAVGDLDGDGTPDLASTSSADGKVRWHDNRSLDCNGNAVPDGCDLDQGGADCDTDGILDACQIGTGTPDCNGNDSPDACDVASGASPDDCGNGIPDECEPDCNGNGVPDSCDISSGTSPDDCPDGIPDECGIDCNGNGVPDFCEIGAGSEVCVNGIPDECEDDCNGNSVPDECDVPPDCNGNGLPDTCDIDAGLVPDCDGNEIPDGCELATVFTERVVSSQPSKPIDVVAADMDADGDLDLLVPAYTGHQVWMFENQDGDGAFGPGEIIATPTAPRAVAAADFDGDGRNDVVYGGDVIAWSRNDPDLGFVETVIDENQVRDVFAADMDGDGDMDVLAPLEDINAVLWFENTDGAGTFAQSNGVAAAYGPRTAVAADLDGDGDLDVVSAKSATVFGPDVVVWYENLNGSEFFEPEQPVGECPGESIVARDLDGDDDLDLLVACEGMRWFENLDGQGGFGDGFEVAADADIRAVAAADLDGDGDQDLLSGSYDDDDLMWYENLDGQATFGPPQSLAIGLEGARAIAAADLDGDGSMDVAATGYLASTVRWYENRSADCNDNGNPDGCDVASGGADDCNLNLVPDSCEIGTGTLDDCNADGVPDGCDPDCNRNQVSDVCEIVSGAGVDCNANEVPDECEATCGPECDADEDECLDPLDCDPDDPEVWTPPGSSGRLLLSDIGETTVLRWAVPDVLGGVAVRYDTLSSTDSADFVASGFCLETDGEDTRSEDPDMPTPGGVFHYLIRVENDCPGGTGSMGSGSDGVPRTGLSCP